MKFLPDKEAVKARLTNIKAWELPKHKSSLAPEDVWTNADMDPVPLEFQTWTIWTWIAYWASDCVNVATWETAASVIAVGLTWREVIPIMFAACVCTAVPLLGNGAMGAKFHIPFAVAVRSGYGFNLAYFAILSRAVMATFWLGVQSVNGSLTLNIMLRAIWPSYNDIPNYLPESAGITTQGMCSYVLFWVTQLPLLLIPPTRLRWMFLTKLIVAPITAIATMAWAIHTAGGSGDIFQLPETVTGSARSWLWLNSMTAVTGSWATLACNIPDFSRYAKSRERQYLQIPVLPVIFTLCGVVSIITTSACKVIYGTYIWNPLDICAKWLESGSGGRAAAFFAALSWYIAQVGTNITANSISAANDFTVMSPRWINIRRGCIIAAVMGGWVIVPWKILASAQTFLNAMASYAIILAPIAGILFSDYWLVKRTRLDLPALYNPRARYHYPLGINWRALLALLVAVGPTLPGLINNINPTINNISVGAKHLYDFGWLFAFWTSVIVYAVLSHVFPAKETLLERSIWSLDPSEPNPYEAIEGREIVVEDGVAAASGSEAGDEKTVDVTAKMG
jgi:NCS1 family nucleobase:cation symporter-1